MKNCTKCTLLKPLSEYHNTSRTKDGKMAACKECRNTYNKAKAAETGHDVLYRRALNKNPEAYRARTREYYEKNAERIKARSGEWNANNADKKRAYGREHYRDNKESYFDSAATWVDRNKDKRKQVASEYAARYRSEPSNRPVIVARKMLSRILECTGHKKKGRTFDILQYNRQQLESHIESLFLDGMSWGNHGEWHIDHIVPVVELVALGVTCPSKINALSNLRPLWAKDNLSKGAGFDLAMQVQTCHQKK